jgi:hypothetical protein
MTAVLPTINAIFLCLMCYFAVRNYKQGEYTLSLLAVLVAVINLLGLLSYFAMETA